jgi:hypothetical protein
VTWGKIPSCRFAAIPSAGRMMLDAEVTETGWLRATTVRSLLGILDEWAWGRTPECQRKLRLFACAACRLVWDQIAPHAEPQTCVEFAERFADGAGSKARLRRLRDANESWLERHQQRRLRYHPHRVEVVRVAGATCEPDLRGRRLPEYQPEGAFAGHSSALVGLLRCIFGNPFRPVEFTPKWRSETAVALASGIYTERAFDRMPILADALEEAGCDHPDVLTHCREPNAHHARGCWVVDGVLGK